MSIWIKNLTIQGFRGISSLKINGLGKINLLTGKNNSGKSSVLETIRILASGGSYRTIAEILEYREENNQERDPEFKRDPEFIGLNLKKPPIMNLFNGFPGKPSTDTSFFVKADSSNSHLPPDIRVTIGWATRSVDPETSRITLEPVLEDLFEDGDRFPVAFVNSGGRNRIIPLDRPPRPISFFRDIESFGTPCVYLDPFSSRSTNQLGRLWDSITLTDSEDEVLHALQIISKDITGVSVIGGPDQRNRIAIARSKNFPHPVPLRNFGDGVNRLFGIILSLCTAKGGILLIDEIENGLHYSVQEEIWHTIFRIARQLDVQVFATSHSWDCVRSFQAAAMRSREEGVLVRLSKHDERTLATTFSEAELEIVTREKIEVR
ncbi:AAA family ATPase (plasmid) [Tistrella mobilis]|uniref:AAA family ATPase n=1 Tax=Tistrella mobilis TaxID=171437 RepID=UPI003556CFD5